MESNQSTKPSQTAKESNQSSKNEEKKAQKTVPSTKPSSKEEKKYYPEEIKMAPVQQKEESKKVWKEDEKNSIDEFQCAICLRLLIEPTHLPCKHRFCNVCIRELLDTITTDEIKCPLCRFSVPETFKLDIDENLEKNLQSKFPKEYKERLEEVDKQKKDLKNLLKVKFLFGNTHQLVNPRIGPSGVPNSHDWTLFFKAANDEIEKQVDQVVFQLHETFHPSKIILKKPPFKVKRTGWGVFEIPIKIHWKKWLQKEVTELSHYLIFDENGETKTFMLRYPSNLKPAE